MGLDAVHGTRPNTSKSMWMLQTIDPTTSFWRRAVVRFNAGRVRAFWTGNGKFDQHLRPASGSLIGDATSCRIGGLTDELALVRHLT